MKSLLIIVLYLVVIIAICTYYIKVQERKHAIKEDNFALGGRSLSTPVVGITIALTGLGAIHVFGLMEMGFIMGYHAAWFIIGQGVLMVVVCLFTGPLVRKYECASMAELVSYVFGEKMRLLVGAATCGVIWGFMTLEAQGLGIVFNAFTGQSIALGIFLGAIVSILYVLLAGVKEIGYVNVVNTVIMFIGVILGVILLGLALPGGSWDFVNNFFQSSPETAVMQSIVGIPSLAWTFGLSLAVAVVFSQSMNQNLLHTCASAKSPWTIRKAVWIVVIINCTFGAFTIAMGMAAKSLPEIAALGPKVGATKMLIEMLPPWALLLLLASFVAAIVSSYAMVALGIATVFTKDVYVPRFKPNASEREQVILIRVLIIVLAFSAAFVGIFLPNILAALGWISSFLAPVFFLFVYGLFWKRSEPAAVITVLVAWIVNMLWTFTSLPEALGMPHDINAYVTISIAIVLGAILTAVMPGKPSFVKTYKHQPLSSSSVESSSQ